MCGTDRILRFSKGVRGSSPHPAPQEAIRSLTPVSAIKQQRAIARKSVATLAVAKYSTQLWPRDSSPIVKVNVRGLEDTLPQTPHAGSMILLLPKETPS